MSWRPACLTLKIDRSIVRYTSTRPDDALLREAMTAVAAERRRFGYGRIQVMLGLRAQPLQGRWRQTLDRLRRRC